VNTNLRRDKKMNYNELQDKISLYRENIEYLKEELADLERQQDAEDTILKFGDIVVCSINSDTRLITFNSMGTKNLVAVDVHGDVQSWEPKKMRPHYEVIGNVFDINIINWMKQTKR
jgi:hypothetical protein